MPNKSTEKFKEELEAGDDKARGTKNVLVDYKEKNEQD